MFGRRFTTGLSLLLLAACLPGKSSRAEDFRIESRVFSGKDTKPVSQNTTLFRAGIVYDYLSDKSVAVFDKPRARFLLLDPARRVKTEVKTEDLQRSCDYLQELAGKESNAFVRFVARPAFETKIDDKTGELVMSSPHMTYRISTIKAESDAAAQQYRDFSDWYVRLNAMTIHDPPFPRLAVNEELCRRGLLATQVQKTVPQQTPLGGRSVSLRSEHHIACKLLQSDLDKLSETESQLGTFKPVSLEEYKQEKVSKR
jgi:hypothetical protein